MQTAIQSSDFVLTSSLRSFINDQVGKTMHSSAEHIHKLTVRLKDVNGPKGGEDKECCIEISIPEQAPVIVKKRSSNAYNSIRNALGRASRITLRRLKKKRATERNFMQPRFNQDLDHNKDGNNDRADHPA